MDNTITRTRITIDPRDRSDLVSRKKVAAASKIAGKGFILALLLIWTLFPIYWMLSLSIRSGNELSGALHFLPHSFSTEHFITLFQEKGFAIAMKNSIKVTGISLLISLACAIPAAYIFSRRRFYFRLRQTAIMWTLVVRILPPIAFAIPLYTMMNRAGLIRTDIPIVLSHVLLNIPFIIWFLISFFTGLPEDLEESAKMDGANEWMIFYKIVFPLVAPGITAVTILSFMTSWNEYLYGVIFVQSPQSFTIPLSLATLNSEQELAQWGSIAAGGVLSLIPILLFVVFAQNYLISGLSNGAVKE